jgi:hypothetical protein
MRTWPCQRPTRDSTPYHGRARLASCRPPGSVALCSASEITIRAPRATFFRAAPLHPVRFLFLLCGSDTGRQPLGVAWAGQGNWDETAEALICPLLTAISRCPVHSGTGTAKESGEHGLEL